MKTPSLNCFFNTKNKEIQAPKKVLYPPPDFFWTKKKRTLKEVVKVLVEEVVIGEE